MPAPFAKNAVFFPLDGFSSLVKDQVTIGVWVHFWVFNSEDGLVGHQWKEKPIGHANFIWLSTGECQGQEVGVVGKGSGGMRVWGTFGIALEM